MTIDFDDDGEGYVKGEKDNPIDWEATKRLEAEFAAIAAEPDDELRLEKAKALFNKMQGD